MKNILKKWVGLFLFFSIFVSFQMKAEEIKSNDSRKVAFNAFSYYSGKDQSNLKIVQEIPLKHLDTILLYAYNFENGFIIVSADDVVEPVLGFGLNNQIDFTTMPPNLLSLLEGYQQEILQAKRLQTKSTQEVRDQWETFLTKKQSKSLYTVSTYLISTKWNQSGGYVAGSSIGYNYYCPVIPNDGRKALVGCGGVALAQILNFWNCRVHPQNTVNYTPYGLSPISINFANQIYNWLGMLPNQANTSNALLLYHCAAALNSQFGANNTSSYPSSASNALITYFGFTSTHYSKNLYSGDWVSLLKNNIDNRKPVFYAGYNSSGGHGWVVDGYSENDYFHCNFGWGGNYDGWYILSNLTGNVSYANSQEAIVNITPTYYTHTTLQNMSIPSNTYTGHTVTVNNANVQNNASVILKANCKIEIYGPFTIPLGATFQATQY
jgi:hypothetical protein